MKGIKFAIVAGICIVLVVLAAQIGTGDKPIENSSAPQQSQEQSLVQTPAPSVQPTPSPSSKPVVAEPGSLQELQSHDLIWLNETPISWGPGRIVNEQNQSAACVGLQEKYRDLGSVFIMNDDKIYLSFDLGYEAGYTQAILDVLKQYQVKAMFFVTGSYAKTYPDTIQRMLNEGHTVGSHSMTHPDMTAISLEDGQKELQDVADILLKNHDYQPYLFRFPAGAFSERTLGMAVNMGYHSVFWSFAYQDWDNDNQPNPDQALETAISSLHPGAVYLLHPMKTNSEILARFIEQAGERGFVFGVL